MNAEKINELVEKQRKYFKTGASLPVDRRIKQLRRLRSAIKRYETQIAEAIAADLGKSNFESYMCEIGLTLDELGYMIKNTKRLSMETAVPTPLTNALARSYQKPSPHGVVLIMSPWNYPFLLTISPLVDAIAAGNTVIVKPSAYSPNTSSIIAKLISSCFSDNHVAVVTGGREENSALLSAHFDYIFFTGSKNVGKLVLNKASNNLTPVTLELGGKSPCIVTADADIKLAARRIVFGKFLNCGQTCVAPDYVFCHKRVVKKFIAEVKKEILRQYGKNPLDNPDYGKIINEKHFNRICSLIDTDKVVFGGKTDPASLKIEPTVMANIKQKDAVMQEEIFGPIMPVLTYESMRDIVWYVNSNDHPLALYIFTSNKQTAKEVIERCGFGGGCINDTIIHLATHEMGFGGFGESGMGAYHGETGFKTFSHYKSIVDRKTIIDVPMRYQPYNKLNAMLIKMFLK